MNYPDNDYEVLFKPTHDPERKPKMALFLIGVFLTPITLIGALWGFRRAYWRKLIYQDLPPSLEPIHPFAKKAMYIFAGVAWILTVGTAILLLIGLTSLFNSNGAGFFFYLIFCHLVPSTIITYFVMRDFQTWRGKMYALRTNANMFGSAKWSDNKDLLEYEGHKGLYIGGGYTYNKMGHMISVAGTRSGKFTNLIAPNLLGAADYDGSWLVIDPKGECAFVTGRYQSEKGNDVQILDPWGVVTKNQATFNPLDIIPFNDNETLIDDATMMAQMIVPDNPSSKDPYWDQRSRSIVAGMIVHAVLKQQESVGAELDIYGQGREQKSTLRTLTTVWRWLRLGDDQFSDVIFDMTESDNEFVRLSGNEIGALKKSKATAYGSVISNAQSHTDFLKSPSLQRSIERSSFDVRKLAEGKTTLYVVIPPDKLDSHGKWLRLVTSAALRAVIRNKGKRVTFVLDEFPSLGKMKDVQKFMAVGAGYNITLWPIFQTLPQLKDLYEKSWQTFLGNAAVKHFWGIGDNETANYVSEMIGGSTYLVYDKNIIGNDKGEPKQRMLATPDEVRRGSENSIFSFIDQKPAAMLPKWDYRDMPKLQGRYDENPYYANIGASK